MSAWHNQEFATHHNGMDSPNARLNFNSRLMMRWISMLSSWMKSGYFVYSGRENEAAIRLGRIGFDHIAGYLKDGLEALKSRPDLTISTERLGAAFIPGVLIVLSCVVTWVLLTVFAVALAQQPKVRRTLQKEIADYQDNAEARAFAAEQAAAEEAAATTATTAGKQLT